MSETATVTGVVHVIEETKTFGQRGFRKRLVVLEDDSGRFTNYLPIEFIQDACDTVDDLSIGDEIRVRYRLSGRKWQRDEHSEVKYFLSAEALRYEVLSAAAGTGAGDSNGSSLDDEFDNAVDALPEDPPF